MPTSRDGEITRIGDFLDVSARRVSRICRSSLAPDAVALGNGFDFTIRIRILSIETLTGCFAKEIIDVNPHYKLLTPFDDSPSVQKVQTEMEYLSEERPQVTDFSPNAAVGETKKGGIVRPIRFPKVHKWPTASHFGDDGQRKLL